MYFVWSLAMTVTGLDNSLRTLTVNRDSMNRELSQCLSLLLFHSLTLLSVLSLFMFLWNVRHMFKGAQGAHVISPCIPLLQCCLTVIITVVIGTKITGYLWSYL